MWLKLDFLNYFTSTVSHPISNVYFASQSIHHGNPYYFNESFQKILIGNSWKKPRNVWWKLTLVDKLQMQWINIFYVNKRIKLHISPNHKVCPFEKTQYKSTVEIGCQPMGRLRPDSATSEFMLHGKFSLLAFTVWPFRTYLDHDWLWCWMEWKVMNHSLCPIQRALREKGNSEKEISTLVTLSCNAGVIETFTNHVVIRVSPQCCLRISLPFQGNPRGLNVKDVINTLCKLSNSFKNIKNCSFLTRENLAWY